MHRVILLTVLLAVATTALPAAESTLPAAGNFGIRHGQYLKYREERPMNNLLLRLAHRFGIDKPSFGDSAGEISELTRAS